MDCFVGPSFHEGRGSCARADAAMTPSNSSAQACRQTRCMSISGSYWGWGISWITSRQGFAGRVRGQGQYFTQLSLRFFYFTSCVPTMCCHGLLPRRRLCLSLVHLVSGSGDLFVTRLLVCGRQLRRTQFDRQLGEFAGEAER